MLRATAGGIPRAPGTPHLGPELGLPLSTPSAPAESSPRPATRGLGQGALLAGRGGALLRPSAGKEEMLFPSHPRQKEAAALLWGVRSPSLARAVPPAPREPPSLFPREDGPSSRGQTCNGEGRAQGRRGQSATTRSRHTRGAPSVKGPTLGARSLEQSAPHARAHLPGSWWRAALG